MNMSCDDLRVPFSATWGYLKGFLEPNWRFYVVDIANRRS